MRQPDRKAYDMAGASDRVPLAREVDLVVVDLADETLIYDRRTHAAHCLNQATAFVWRACDGRRSVASIAASLEEKFALRPDSGAVWLALAQLEKADLLIEPLASFEIVSQRRRQVLRTALRTGVQVALIPTLNSIIVPTAAAAVSPVPTSSPTASPVSTPATTARLLGLARVSGVESLVVVDPATGGISPLGSGIPNATGVVATTSALDPATHRYFVIVGSQTGSQLVVLNTQAGGVVSSSPALTTVPIEVALESG